MTAVIDRRTNRALKKPHKCGQHFASDLAELLAPRPGQGRSCAGGCGVEVARHEKRCHYADQQGQSELRKAAKEYCHAGSRSLY